MTYLLDTDTCIGVLRQRPGMVQRLSQVLQANLDKTFLENLPKGNKLNQRPV